MNICPKCSREFTTPQGLGLHFKHGCQPSILSDLALLVKRLVHALEKVNYNPKLQAQAMEYLRRKGLDGFKRLYLQCDRG